VRDGDGVERVKGRERQKYRERGRTRGIIDDNPVTELYKVKYFNTTT
jgi:hypothetical protein